MPDDDKHKPGLLSRLFGRGQAEAVPAVRAHYAEVRDLTSSVPAGRRE